MARKSLLLWCIFGAFLTVDAGQIARGSFVVEFQDNQDLSVYRRLVEAKADTVMSFDYSLFKGESIQFKDLETAEHSATELLELECIKNIWPKQIYSRPNAKALWTGSSVESMLRVKRQNVNDTFSPHVQTQVDRLRANGITGKGVKIAVIDTGIDYTHPALGGCFGTGCLVADGYDLVGDAYTGTNVPVPDSDPWDGCGGHGTHVAGIIAAQQNQFGFTGAAPDVKLAAYRVFGCEGDASNDVIIDAYMRAVEDGANIITASLGDTGGWSQDPWSVVVTRIVDSGIPCVLSAGNDGSMGLFHPQTPANGKRVAAIASYDNSIYPILLVPSSFRVNGGDSKPFGYTSGSPRSWAGVELPLWAPSFNSTENGQGCTELPDGTPDLSDKVILIRRGGCTIAKKVQNVADKGARYILIYNNIGGTAVLETSVTGVLGIGMLRTSTGVALINALASGSEVVLSMGDPIAARLEGEPNNRTGGFISTTSSWGPAWDGDMNPEFGVPGGYILSTYPVSLGSYAVLSGTSMSCPLVAAIYALLSNVRGTLDPALLHQYLSSTAIPNLLNTGDSTFPLLAPVAQQGAGLLQAWEAAHVTTLLSPSSIMFNDTDYLKSSVSFTITNTENQEVTYNISSVGAATAYTFSDSTTPDPFPGLKTDDSFAHISMNETKITIPPHGQAAVAVTVKPPAVDAKLLPVYSGYITLNGTNGENLSLPYQGIAGSLNSQTVLGNWALFASTDTDNPITASNSTFAIPSLSNNSSSINNNSSLPTAIADMVFGSPLVYVEAIPVDGGSLAKGNATGNSNDIFNSPKRWVSRVPVEFEFNGTMADHTIVPAGRYKLRVRALHIFGNEDTDDSTQWDVAETPEFFIQYA
ncbi:subtilase [Corynespora cassiicola Philippines]|uniref:Subtilase n=1 Tax=Corynespora cassiicola Philippines TaxID=1448308 RepID=A0A2T2P4A1_CORCC|nr:subtilase [Corynespora cassiicola Philippines]